MNNTLETNQQPTEAEPRRDPPPEPRVPFFFGMLKLQWYRGQQEGAAAHWKTLHGPTPARSVDRWGEAGSPARRLFKNSLHGEPHAAAVVAEHRPSTTGVVCKGSRDEIFNLSCNNS